MRHEDRMWYRRTFDIPAKWTQNNQRILIHFDAVDFQAAVFVNGKSVGAHKGGYDAFTLDITDALKPAGPQELSVNAYDGTDVGNQPRGKQTNTPGGIFYTPASGIWQTVWLEPVPATSVQSLHILADLDAGAVKITAQAAAGNVSVTVMDGANQIAKGEGKAGAEIKIDIPNAKLWTPDSPFLYTLRVTLSADDKSTDSVESYFGMRKISLAKDDKGVQRLMLNNKPIFQAGPLDQGFWPDGIYTAPTDEALRYDIEITKKLGFNMTRKHVKVEPERWYYWCDKLGLLVWQDMPAMRDKPNADQQKQYETELAALVKGRGEHPSIIMWVVFNEGWGQYDTERLTKWVKDTDPSRIVNNASGWTDMKVGDVNDMHHYPDPAMPKPEENRAVVLGEFGGLGLGVDGHTWSKKSWGYRGVGSPEQLTTAYVRAMAAAWRLKDDGLCAAVYTQITDVETECNGLLTYDRAVIKVDVPRTAAVNTGHIPQIKVITPTSEKAPVKWQYTLEAPPADWTKPGFDASTWKEAEGGFGTDGTPGAVVRTKWSGRDIWIRREFTMTDEKLNSPSWLLHPDDDAEVYINGVLALKETGYVGSYQEFSMTDEAKAALKPGKNIITAHCRQNAGGQYIDVGIVDVKEDAR